MGLSEWRKRRMRKPDVVDSKPSLKISPLSFKPGGMSARVAILKDGKYTVNLPSRGITVVTKDISQARTLDNAEAVIEANG